MWSGFHDHAMVGTTKGSRSTRRNKRVGLGGEFTDKALLFRVERQCRPEALGRGEINFVRAQMLSVPRDGIR